MRHASAIVPAAEPRVKLAIRLERDDLRPVAVAVLWAGHERASELTARTALLQRTDLRPVAVTVLWIGNGRQVSTLQEHHVGSGMICVPWL